jgi:3-isopropylmalate/(R)-2-methylmalate dehydratase small subunit
MQPFTKLTSVAAPMRVINVDTDMIIPKQYLKTIKRTGLGTALFSEMRYDDKGNENPEFVLNKPAYRKALRLVTRTCALGFAGFWHSLRDFNQLCRYFL